MGLPDRLADILGQGGAKEAKAWMLAGSSHRQVELLLPELSAAISDADAAVGGANLPMMDAPRLCQLAGKGLGYLPSFGEVFEQPNTTEKALGLLNEGRTFACLTADPESDGAEQVVFVLLQLYAIGAGVCNPKIQGHEPDLAGAVAEIIVGNYPTSIAASPAKSFLEKLNQRESVA